MQNPDEKPEQLDWIMEPKSIAVIGASTRPHTIGSDIVKKILGYKYTGKLYLINIKGGLIEGIQSHKSILDVEDPVDMAILVVNAKLILGEIDKCHQKGIKGLVIIASGFKETGEEKNIDAEKQIIEKINQYKMRLVGPNSLGVINTDPAFSMDASFAETLPERGDIGFVSQSGALGGGILNILRDLNLGFAQFISIGNQAEVNSEKAIEYWENKPQIKEILLYIESITNPLKFLQIAQKVSKKKPILALKSGRTEEGSRAAMSHTGSLTGKDKAINCLMKQAGVIREFSLKNMFNSAKVFSTCKIPKGDRIAVITNSGGPGIMCTDAIIDSGMKMANLNDNTLGLLKKFLPSQASVKNPVDMIASAPLEHYKNSLNAVLSDDGVDMVVVIYLPFLELKDMDVARTLIEIKATTDKPIVGVFMTESQFFIKIKELNPNMPFYLYAEEAVVSLSKLNQQRKWLERPVGEVKKYEIKEENLQVIKNIFEKVKGEGRDKLTTDESLCVLDNYGIRIGKQAFAKTEEELVAKAKEIGYPVVMKVNSKDISHKNDIGGIRTNILNEEQLKKEYKELINNLKEKNLLEGLEGIIIQEFIQSKKEIAIGVSTDEQIGHLIMFGIGGIFIEIINDVSFRVCPITDVDAGEMIKEIKCYKILEGVRGTKKANIEQIQDTICRINDLVEKFSFIKELDINPLLIEETNGDAIAVDCRIKI